MKIDIVQQFGAVTRAVENRVHDGCPARVVVASRTYDTTVEHLWDALTSRERIPRWFLPISSAVGVGWDLALAGLANHTATGESVKPSDGLAWLLSEDGREFVRRASDDWGRASIVSGTDQAAAHAAVARTTAAYSPPSAPAATETAG